MENLKSHTESEQMYLVSMARISEVIEECPIPVSKIADVLSVTSISANQMIHHLEEIGLVNYTPYKGVEFTPQGWQVAKAIIQKRRLWEVFFVEKLQYDPAEANEMACRLEHVISDETARRLAEYLEWPSISPMGKDIPQSNPEGVLQPGFPLRNLPLDSKGIVSMINAGQEECRFLDEAGIRIGAEISVLGSKQDSPVLVELESGDVVNLSGKLSDSIWVRSNS
jgi:DtxR family Mn-dependent transcriptional regulator